MIDIVTLLFLLISLYTSGFDSFNPAFAHMVFADAQANGMEAAIGNLKTNYSSIIAGSENDITMQIPGEDVKAEEPAQPDHEKELKNLGFYRDDESTDAMLNLRNGILRFQSSCNLTVDGIWGNKSREALALMFGSKNASCEDVIDTPPSQGKWLVINKSKRILTLYENRNVIKKYPIAIGNPPSLTPDGKFTIVSKVINPAWGGGGYAKPVKGGIPDNPLGYRWLGLSYKNGDDLGVHGNNSPYSIGKNVSHGCIRMINSDVEELFEIVPRSARVWIGTDAILKEWGIVQKVYSKAVKE